MKGSNKGLFKEETLSNTRGMNSSKFGNDRHFMIYDTLLAKWYRGLKFSRLKYYGHQQ